MSDSALSVNASSERTLNDLLNLALRTPEVGAVNFNLLHTFLSTVIQQLNLQDVVAHLPAEQTTFKAPREEEVLLSETTQRIDGLANKLSAIETKVDAYSSVNATSTTSGTNSLDKRVEILEKHFQAINELPNNQSLIERSRSDSHSSPATEIWQQMQLQKKVEANEEGVTRALSLIDDLMRELHRVMAEQELMKAEMKRISERIEQTSDMSSVFNRLSAVEAYKDDITLLRSDVDYLTSKLSGYPDSSEFDSFITWPVLEEALTQHMAKMEELQRQKEIVEEIVDASHHTTPASSRPTSSRLSSAKQRFPQATEMLEQIGALNDRHTLLDGRVCVLEETMPTKQDKLDLDKLLEDNKNSSLPDDLLEQLAQLREALDALERDKEQEETLISTLQNAMLNIQAELERLHALIQTAIDEHDNKQKHIDSLYGCVEKLEEIKADKELVKMEVDVKADKRALANKVNRSDFDHTTSELGKNVDDLLKKIITQEEEWQTTAKEISADVSLKLDRMELESLKQYLENRLKAMKKLLDQKSLNRDFPSDDDAAGFRKQLIQNYHCISCDRVVDLTPSGPVASIPANSALPSSRTVRPYTSFELDQLRQQARGDSSDMDSMTPSGRPCGGSYTLTFPHRRYTRLTHLSDLWQQEEEEEALGEVNKEEVELQGHDGHIYKGRLPTISLASPEQKRSHGIDLSPRPSSARHRVRNVPMPRRPLSGGERLPSTNVMPDHSIPRLSASAGGR